MTKIIKIEINSCIECSAFVSPVYDLTNGETEEISGCLKLMRMKGESSKIIDSSKILPNCPLDDYEESQSNSAMEAIRELNEIIDDMIIRKGLGIHIPEDEGW